MTNIKATTRTSTFLKKSYELAFTAMAMMLMAQVALAQVSMTKNNDDDSMSLKVDGSEKVIIQKDGRMGVNLNGNKPNISFLDVSGTLQLGQYDNPGTSYAGNIVFRTLRANTSEGYGSGNPTGDNRAWMVAARGHSDALYPGLFSLQYWGGTDWVNALNLDKSGKVGVITKQPVTALDVSGTLMISNGGEACNASTEGAIRYTAAGGVMYCDATSWTSMGGGGSSDSIAAGDTSVSIVDAGTGQIHFDVDGNRLITALDGALNVSGSLSVSSGISVPKENGVGFFGESPYAAAPLSDGARLYVNKDYFGTNLDAFVVEKTDFNNDMADGGVVFTVRDQNNTVYENMVIRGAGGVSITVHDTSSALIVTAPNLTKSSALTLRELPLSTGEGDGKAIGILASGESTARFMVYTDGKLGIGDGSSFRDVYLSRSGLNTFLVSEDGVSGTADLHVTGTVSATAFVGDGSGLTGVAGGLWTNNTDYIDYEGVRVYKTGTTWDLSFGDAGMFYHQDKTALRLGTQNNGSADEASVGQYSLGVGNAVIASGDRAIAMGLSSTASGADSFAVGNGAEATGARAVAMGNGARALNSDAIAIGSGTYASNLFSIALGRSTAATQNSAFAVGNGARASGVTSVALGMGTEAKNNYSLATNYQTIASGAQSVAMGRGSQANGITSFAFGEGVIAQGNYSYVIGLNNDISGTTVTDARTMAILGGEVGIGLTSPSVELDVSGSIQYTGNLLDASDRRLKQNIQPIEDGALERMGQVEAVSFEMKDRPGVTELGVIAQDFENIYPELVKTADDEMGTKSVNYIGMIAPMVKAMQELKAEVDELKAQNAEQARLIEELQAK